MPDDRIAMLDNPEVGMAEFNPLAGRASMYMPGASFIHRLHGFLYEPFEKGLH